MPASQVTNPIHGQPTTCDLPTISAARPTLQANGKSILGDFESGSEQENGAVKLSTWMLAASSVLSFG